MEERRRFRLEVLTPEKPFFVGEVVSLTIPVSDGMIGIEALREPLAAAVKDGKLAAYTLGTLQDTTRGVLEQIAAAKDKRNTGVILLPFTATVEAFRKMGGTMAAYAIYGTNQRANALRDKLVNISAAKSSQNYYLYK